MLWRASQIYLVNNNSQYVYNNSTQTHVCQSVIMCLQMLGVLHQMVPWVYIHEVRQSLPPPQHPVVWAPILKLWVQYYYCALHYSSLQHMECKEVDAAGYPQHWLVSAIAVVFPHPLHCTYSSFTEGVPNGSSPLFSICKMLCCSHVHLNFAVFQLLMLIECTMLSGCCLCLLAELEDPTLASALT